MPITLSKPHVHNPGHGAAQLTYAQVEIREMSITIGESLVLKMEYGNTVDGQWQASPERPKALPRIRNHPPVMTAGTDPETGAYVEQELEPARPEFDDLMKAFLLKAGDAGKLGYVAFQQFLLQYVIDEGYYAGVVEG